MKFKKLSASLLLVTVLIFSEACQVKKEALIEPPKDLSGIWRISKVVRNSVEITPWIDSAGFRLELRNDNTYILQNNRIPFIVNTNGTWAADDPLYPFQLSFLQTDSTNTKIGNITTPVVKAERNFDITFSPGCFRNTYVYSFTKIND